jgi:hypothetical protein
MIIVSLLRWWYGEGLLKQMYMSRGRIAAMADYFSIELLIKTLFSPFRQISAGNRVQGPIGVKFRAFLDKLVSRCVGAVIRLLTIVIGIGGLLFSCVLAVASVAGWVLLPVAPAIGLILSLRGWVPWIL